MKFWQVLALVEMDHLGPLSQHAETLGFEGIALGDHFITYESQYQAYDYSKDSVVLWFPETHWPDCWVQIGALSMLTTTLKFTTTVYVLPMRDPFAAAKAIQTAAYLSKNRVVLGVGVGWQKDEFDLVAKDFHTRGKRADEMLELLPRLMSGEMLEYHGEYYDFPRLQMSPGVPAMPVLIGGTSPAAMKRAARHDGWIGGSLELDQIPDFVSALRAERAALGREKEPFEIGCSLYSYTPDTVKRAEDMGITQIHKSAFLGPDGRAARMPLDEKLRDMDRFAETFLA